VWYLRVLIVGIMVINPRFERGGQSHLDFTPRMCGKTRVYLSPVWGAHWHRHLQSRGKREGRDTSAPTRHYLSNLQYAHATHPECNSTRRRTPPCSGGGEGERTRRPPPLGGRPTCVGRTLAPTLAELDSSAETAHNSVRSN
jgi:hypothetical protein